MARLQPPLRSGRGLLICTCLALTLLAPRGFLGGLAPKQGRRGGSKLLRSNSEVADFLTGGSEKPAAEKAAEPAPAAEPEAPAKAAVAPAAEAAAAPLPPPKRAPKVTALNEAGTSFLLEFAGQRLLINPDIAYNEDFPPEKVHEMVDYVIITSAKKQFLHPSSIAKMNLRKTNFVVAAAVQDTLNAMMAQNMAVLEAGPEGRVLLEGEEGSSPLAIMVVPGAGGQFWEKPEIGFIFIDLDSGEALGYEALSQYCGKGAGSEREGIPEAAYQIDYLVGTDMTETADCVKGLAEKGCKLKGVVTMPNQRDKFKEEAEGNPILGALLMQDKMIGAVLGEVNDADAFRDFLQEEDNTAQTKLYEVEFKGSSVTLE